MSKTLNDYIKEFGCYLQEKGKSKLTVDGYKRITYRLLKYTQKQKHYNVTPENLTWEDISKFVSKVASKFNYSHKKGSYSALKKYMKFLKFKYKNTAFDDYEKEKEITDEDIFYMDEKKRTKKVRLTKKEAIKMVNASKDNLRNHAIISLFYYSWQRIGSIVNLNKENVDWEGKINPKDSKRYHKITIIGAKNDETYDIEIESEPIEAIKEYLNSEDRKNEQIIPREGKTSYNGRKIKGYVEDNYGRELYHEDCIFTNGTGGRLQYKAMCLMMKDYAVKCGIKKKMHSHIWRATGISIAEGNKVPLSQIMARSGHRNIQSLRPYLSPDENETKTNICNALNLSETKEEIPQPPQELEKPKEPQKPKIQPQNNYIANIHQRFAMGEISETAYLIAVKNLENNTSNSHKVGYQ